MNFLKYSFLIMVLFCGNVVNAVAEYKTAQDALQAITSAHVNAFAVDNLLSSGMPENGAVYWSAALNGIETYINKNLAKERPLGSRISQKNQDIINNSLVKIRSATHDLITTLNALRAANFNFALQRYPEINLDTLKLQIAQLVTRANELKTFQKNLTPGILDSATDVKDTKDMKKLLKDVLFILEQTFLKINKDFKNLQPYIYAAINSQKGSK